MIIHSILYYRKGVLVQEFNGDAVVNIIQMLRLDLIGGGHADRDTVEWQCLKNNGVMLTKNQWRALARSVERITKEVNALDEELAIEFT